MMSRIVFKVRLITELGSHLNMNHLNEIIEINLLWQT